MGLEKRKVNREVNRRFEMLAGAATPNEDELTEVQIQHVADPRLTT